MFKLHKQVIHNIKLSKFQKNEYSLPVCYLRHVLCFYSNTLYSTSAPSARSSTTTGIIMMNMGGPNSLSDVQNFLLNLFSDRDLLKLPMQTYMAKLITHMRKNKIIQHYAQIGNRSPILSLTQNQLDSILHLLRDNNYNTIYKGYIGFRYAQPYLQQAIETSLKECDSIVLFNQYMQYSCSTSGSSFIEAYRHLKKQDKLKKVYVIDRWFIYQPFVDAYAELIDKCLVKNNLISDSCLNKTILLFSAHSVPITNLIKGDPYPFEVSSSVENVMHKLNNEHKYRGKLAYNLVWQSKVGPKQWLEPHTDHTIEIIAKRKEYKNIVVVPITFTTDHIETLHELDIELKQKALDQNLNFYRVEALNNNETFIRGMADLIKKFVSNKAFTNPKMFVRCKGCTNLNCLESKAFFKNLISKN